MNNYRDLSSGSEGVAAGFQFEFNCESCGRTWRSAFTPYRTGQVAGWLERFSFMVSGNASATRLSSSLASAGARKAREHALDAARIQARQLYTQCEGCRRTVCRDCWDAASGRCRSCAGEDVRAQQIDGPRAAVASGALRCPSCQAPSDGSRFCTGCGFDFASTHKSCPGCGALVARQARFCADCGHGF